jgi:hypothetical protein
VLKFQEHYREYRELGAINAGAANALDYDYLGETGHGTGDDVLRLESDDFKIYHLGFAPRDPNLRVYEKLSSANPNRATDHQNQTEPDPTNGDDFGFYTSRQIPNLYDPPALTERLSIRNASAGQFLQFGFLADGVAVPDGGSNLIITGRTYELQPITDPAEQDFLLTQATLDREDQRLKTIVTQVGGLFSYEIGEALPDAWAAIDGIARDLVFEGLEAPGSQPGVPSQPGGGRQLEVASPGPTGPDRRGR